MGTFYYLAPKIWNCCERREINFLAKNCKVEEDLMKRNGNPFFSESREIEKTIPKSAHPKTWDFFFISPPYWFTQPWKQTLWVIVYCLDVDLSPSSFVKCWPTLDIYLSNHLSVITPL